MPTQNSKGAEKSRILAADTTAAKSRARRLMAEGEVLQSQNRPAAESAGKNGDDGTHEREHAGDTTAVILKTLDFSPLLEFLVGTGVQGIG